MSTESATALLTAEEFYELPDAPHGGKMELICGRLVTHMPVGRNHSRIALRVGSRLERFIVGRRAEAVLRDLKTGDEIVRLRLPGAPSFHLLSVMRVIWVSGTFERS